MKSPLIHGANHDHAKLRGVYPRDLVKRTFAPARLNMIWTSAVTCRLCGHGSAYKFSIRHDYSGRIFGWAVVDHMREALVIAALKKACVICAQQIDGIICQAARGTQFNSQVVRRHCRFMGLKRSMGATVDFFDLAIAESCWSIFENECYCRHAFTNLTQLTQGITGFIHPNNTTRGFQGLES